MGSRWNTICLDWLDWEGAGDSGFKPIFSFSLFPVSFTIDPTLLNRCKFDIWQLKVICNDSPGNFLFISSTEIHIIYPCRNNCKHLAPLSDGVQYRYRQAGQVADLFGSFSRRPSCQSKKHKLNFGNPFRKINGGSERWLVHAGWKVSKSLL